MTPPKSRPLIGVTVEILDAPFYEGQRRFQLFHAYMPVLRDAGAIPLLIPGDATAADIAAILPLLDGIMMTGGDDADLRAFGGPAPLPECKAAPIEQQEMNLNLVRSAIGVGMPVLGICYGMQMLGLAYDAPFIQHLRGPHAHAGGIRHMVTAEPGTRLSTLLGNEAFEVPSFHHQALASAGATLQATAWSPDGVLEAVELPGPAFTLGVQWHPEKDPKSEASKRLFSGFVNAANDYRK